MSTEPAGDLPTAHTLIEQLPARLRPDIAGSVRLTVQLDLTGEGGGQWWVRVANGRCTVGTGPADRPDVVLNATAPDYVRIRLGQLHPMAATTNGQLKVEGKFGLAIKFATMFQTGP